MSASVLYRVYSMTDCLFGKIHRRIVLSRPDQASYVLFRASRNRIFVLTDDRQNHGGKLRRRIVQFRNRTVQFFNRHIRTDGIKHELGEFLRAFFRYRASLKPWFDKFDGTKFAGL